ncbi:MAG: mechanosensitive ion channel family protein [Candidatus Caenarcaniphilales bacterium]|nr:mechanosensitive ion channel family protein [Candidatus Caenarcaniphilales bacterium]
MFFLIDLEALLILVASLIAGIVVEKLIFKNLLKHATQNEWNYLALLLRAVKGKFILLTLVVGIFFAAKELPLPIKTVANLNKTLLAFTIILITAFTASVAGRFISINSTSSSGVIPSATILNNISKVLIYLIGFLVIVNSLGISITPIVTALGIGGLAVSLALQETLSNLFAGMQILISKQIKPGHLISLESKDSNVSGCVSDIGWRTTIIRDPSNNLVIVPNKNISSAVIRNYDFPESELSLSVKIGVSYESDLDFVEKVTIDVAKQIMKEVEGAVPDFSPFIRYNGFGDFAINFSVILRAKDYDSQFLIIHEFIKRLQKRYKQEGIIIPFPTRTIEVKAKDEKAVKNSESGL